MHIQGRITKQQFRAIDFFADCLFSHQLKRHLWVEIRNRKMNENEMYGYVFVESYNIRGKPRHFVIVMNSKLSPELKIRTLAHEMVHIKQYAYDELNEEMTMWHGRKIDSDKISYFEQPWEVEAWKKGDKIYEKFWRLT